MALTTEKIKAFRSIGHHLKPVVIVAEQGLSEGVQQELDRALNDHELIKVKISYADREHKQALLEELVALCGCELVQSIGKTALIYRPAPQANPKLSNIARFYQRG